MDIVIHFFWRDPPHRSFPRHPVSTHVAIAAWEKVPVKVGIAVSEEFVVHFLGAKGCGDGFRDNGHLKEELGAEVWLKEEQLRVVVLAEKERVAVEILMIAEHDIPSIEFCNEIGVATLFDVVDTCAD